ncbi:hypothetical protein VB773_13050 [Haloarculaceae archaeon H-GB2-1]|nr:hypothetical protein [Haloarculaceae archaeon H-GB1-1]MEA5408399.1 hypothetical protein [Haloarculaceae archaeon H-GB2-1]
MTRGQAHTMEGIVAGLLLLSAMVFALQMTAVTPLTASTSSQHIENQQQAAAEGVLATAGETGALRRAVLYWNDTDGAFHGAENLSYYTNGPPPNEFGEILDRTFERRGVAYNVYVTFLGVGDDYRDRRMVYQGVPSDNAVQASYTVTLADDASIYDDDETKNATLTVSNATSFYAQDTGADSSLFNVVRVEVIAWRI